ncbi:MAG: 30S ribosomal protein S9 [Candidatus Firestonebacteria bacterium]|nr:30S ribosomal protein S9 [Candidatus Firestonebacteria bacterium]
MDNNVLLISGRRKEAVARAKVVPGKGTITVNGKTLKDYFFRDTLVSIILQPLGISDTFSKYDIYLDVSGGGLSGQAGAARLAIAKAILEIDPGTKMALKKSHFLTRDPRMKERKKYGQRGARARFQFSKR